MNERIDRIIKPLFSNIFGSPTFGLLLEQPQLISKPLDKAEAIAKVKIIRREVDINEAALTLIPKINIKPITNSNHGNIIALMFIKISGTIP